MSPVTRSGLIQLYVLGDEVTNKPIADNLTFASYGNDKSTFSEKKLSTSWGKVHEDTNMQSFEKLLQDLNLICYLLSRVVYHLLLSSFLFF